MKPRIAITAGDPAGIGPEIAAKAAASPRVRAVCEPIIYESTPSEPVPIGQVSPQAGRAADEHQRHQRPTAAQAEQAVTRAHHERARRARPGITDEECNR